MSKQMLYKKGGKQKIHGQMLKTCVVDESEVEQLVAEGWSKTTTFEQGDETDSTVVPNNPAIHEALGICAVGLKLVDTAEGKTADELADLIVNQENEPEQKGDDKATDDEKSDRELLEDRANALGVEFRSNIHDDTLLERVEEAEQEEAQQVEHEDTE